MDRPEGTENRTRTRYETTIHSAPADDIGETSTPLDDNGQKPGAALASITLTPDRVVPQGREPPLGPEHDAVNPSASGRRVPYRRNGDGSAHQLLNPDTTRAPTPQGQPCTFVGHEPQTAASPVSPDENRTERVPGTTDTNRDQIPSPEYTAQECAVILHTESAAITTEVVEWNGTEWTPTPDANESHHWSDNDDHDVGDTY